MNPGHQKEEEDLLSASITANPLEKTPFDNSQGNLNDYAPQVPFVVPKESGLKESGETCRINKDTPEEKITLNLTRPTPQTVVEAKPQEPLAIQEPTFIPHRPTQPAPAVSTVEKISAANTIAESKPEIMEVKDEAKKPASSSFNDYRPSTKEHVTDESVPKVDVGIDLARKPVVFIIRTQHQGQNFEMSRTFTDFQNLQTRLEETFYFLVLPALPHKDWVSKIIPDNTKLLHQANVFQMYLTHLLSVPELQSCLEVQAFLTDNKAWLQIGGTQKSMLGAFWNSTGEEITRLRTSWNEKRISTGKFNGQEKEVGAQTELLRRLSEEVTHFSESLTRAKEASRRAGRAVEELKKLNSDVAINSPEGKPLANPLLGKFLGLIEEYKYNLECCKNALDRKNVHYLKLDDLQQQANRIPERKLSTDPNAISLITYLHSMKEKRTVFETRLAENLTKFLADNAAKILAAVREVMVPAMSDALKK